MRHIINKKKLEISAEDFSEINNKIKIAKMILTRPPDKGGAPFIYSFTATKRHFLEDIKLPIYTDDNGNVEYFYTAATNGKEYLWSPQMLKRLTPFEISVVMSHETYHIVLQHADRNRVLGRNKQVWNIAVDYVVNSMIEHDFRVSKFKEFDNYNQNYNQNEHPIWKGGLGKPLLFEDLLKSIKKARQEYEKNKNNSKPTPKEKPDLTDLRMYADYSLHGESAESIYNKLMEELGDLAKDPLNELLESLGLSELDDHQELDEKISRSELLRQVLEAATAAKQMTGNLPASIEDHLLKLQEPKLSWQDFIKNTLQTKRQEKGMKNDWSRFRRRNTSLGIYSPKKKDQFVSWLAMLDTSGSMSSEDMTYGVSQLKCLDGRSKGVVVPCDAKPYWEHITKIQRMDDLPNINPVGRGGTAFAEFFNDYEKYVGNNFDIIVIMTDGGVWDLHDLKPPSVSVIWVLTNNCDFNPPFGKVLPMRNF